MANKIQLRRDTAAAWYDENPKLSQGEPGVEIDTGKLKIGDGIALWRALPYVNSTDLPPDAQGYLANDGVGNLSWINLTTIQGVQGVQGVQGIQGVQGVQGARGEVTTVSYIFDGGTPSTNYSNGPAFNCGGVN
jgi:hypothetical protein